MADTLTFELVTPLGIHKGDGVQEVVIPAESGEMGVLPGHDVMIVQLGIGPVVVTYPDRTDVFFAARGYVEIDHDTVRILAEITEPKDEIDMDRAKESMARAKERLDKPTDDVDWERATSNFKRNSERIRILTEY